MKVLIATSEIVPFAKTGGLADVTGALPKALRRIGVEADCILPRYRCVDELAPVPEGKGLAIHVPMGHREEPGTVEEVRMECGGSAFLVRNGRYFDREFLYGTKDGDYVDNCERFTFFCRAVMEWIHASGRRYDVIHCNDWQTALIPVYVKTLYGGREPFGSMGTVFTVHNLGYQGLFWNHDLPMTGLGWDMFTPQTLEFYGKVNLMKGGLVFADILSTVSATYSREIQNKEHGYGLEGVLYERREDLYGIVNGIDYDEWNPATDRWIAANYSAADLSGKEACRRDLQAEFGLEAGNDPVLGIIGRLTGQKGFDLLEQIGDWLADQPLRLVILGAGERQYEDAIRGLSERHPGRSAVRVGYDNVLAHKIEAGADMYLMPSLYEPCGLNQIYSLIYGTVPIVRETGGLADTVVDADENPSEGTGFAFREYDAGELKDAVSRALSAFADRARWRSIVLRGMARDFSWETSAGEYVGLYEKALRKRGRKG